MSARTSSEPVKPEVERANRYHAFLEGWRDGAATKAMRPEFKGHRLGVDYEDGYHVGYVARGAAADEAAKRYGHRPDFLRLCDKDGSP